MRHHFELRESINHPILYGTSYEPSSIHGVIVFIHDVNESRTRYESLAKFFNERHMVFVTYDLRGHYQSLIYNQKGHFGDIDGASQLLQDALDVIEYMKHRFPYVPMMLMGQGFGAHLATLVFDYNPNHFKHLVLVNALSLPRFSDLRLRILNALTLRKPRMVKSSLNKWMTKTLPYKNEKERYAFLSHQDKIINDYIKNPFCGYQLTQRAIKDALEIMVYSRDCEISLSKRPVQVSIIGGKDNPLTQMGQDLVALKRQYIQAGYSNTTLSIFDGLKHDVLLEVEDSFLVNQLLTSLCNQMY